MSLANFKASNHPQQTAKRGPIEAVDDRSTDPAFVANLEMRLGQPFTLDVAASAHNTKAPVHYSREEDGLLRQWRGVVWCNPPFSDCGAWVRKAWSEWCDHEWLDAESVVAGRFEFCEKCDREKWSSGLVRQGESPDLIAMLLPANRVEQGWWQDHVEPFRDRPGSPLRVEFLRGRMRFERPGWIPSPKGDRPPFGCALLIWSDR